MRPYIDCWILETLQNKLNREIHRRTDHIQIKTFFLFTHSTFIHSTYHTIFNIKLINLKEYLDHK